MSTRMPPPFDPVEHALDGALDEEDHRAVVDAAAMVPPSFAAIVARAHHIDPRAVATEDIERAGKLTAVARAGALASEPDDLDEFLEVLRAEAARDIIRREQLGAPPCGLLTRLESQRRAAHTRRWIAGISAVAAAAAMVVGLDWLESWNARRSAERAGSTQSVSAVRDGPVVHDAAHIDPAVPARPVRRPPPQGRVATPPTPEMPATLPAVPMETQPAELQSESTRGAPAVPRAGVAKVPADAALRRLDTEAQAAHARGDRIAADELYGRIIARGRRHPLVEIAYAERFSLARGQGTAVQRALWDGYLAKFPAGRFADDAHAGLCRTAAVADKAACWRGYVDRFPAGAYRQHADRWFTSTATP